MTPSRTFLAYISEHSEYSGTQASNCYQYSEDWRLYRTQRPRFPVSVSCIGNQKCLYLRDYVTDGSMLNTHRLQREQAVRPSNDASFAAPPAAHQAMILCFKPEIWPEKSKPLLPPHRVQPPLVDIKKQLQQLLNLVFLVD